MRDSILLSAAKWKRQFFATESFATVDELLDAAAVPGSRAAEYVNAALQLRFKANNRRSLDDLKALRCGIARPTRWLTTFSSSLWMLYRSEKELCVQSKVADEPTDLHTMTKEQRKHFAGTGMLRRRKLPMKLRVKKAKAAIDSAMKDKLPVVWIDNFNRQRYARNPTTSASTVR